MTNKFYLPMYSRLEPSQVWRGGRITPTDLLTLEEAAREACSHSGEIVSVNDFLRAAARGEITLRAIVHTSAKVEKFDGGIFCNQGDTTENTVPKGAIPTLPLVACQQLASVGSASWRTFDGFEFVDGVMCRFTVATLIDGEPDFETVIADCRVIGADVHALADAFASEQSDDPPSVEDSLFIQGFYDGIIQAGYWLKLPEVAPSDAAHLLAGFSPLSADMRLSGGSREHQAKLYKLFCCDVFRSAPRNLIAWMEIACRHGMRCHAWIHEYLRCKTACKTFQISGVNSVQ